MPSDHSASATVLVVDDDAKLRDLMSDLLRGERYLVYVAGTLDQARRLLSRRRFDVVVLDLNLPDGDGVDLCRDLRADGYRGAIVMVSARDATVDRILGLEFGGHEEAQRAAGRVADGVQLRVHAPFGTAYEAAKIPFLTRRLDAVRCALR